MPPRALLALALTTLALAAAAAAEATPEAFVRESKIELFVTEVAESTQFYAALGFEVAAAKPDGYTTLRQGSTVIALSPLPSWLPLRCVGFLRYPPIGTEIVLYTEDLEGAREALVAADQDPGEITRQPWGDLDFRLTDPDGYYVRVSEGMAVRTDTPPTDPGQNR